MAISCSWIASRSDYSAKHRQSMSPGSDMMDACVELYTLMSHEVVAGLIIQSQRILLGQRSPDREFYPGVWDVFGGHMEPSEAQAQTLVRELQEELGITPTHWTFVETLRVPAQQLTVHLYLVAAWDGTPLNRQPEEHSEIRWFSLEEATGLRLADPGYPALFERVLAVNSGS